MKIDRQTERLLSKKIDELNYNLNSFTRHIVNQKINQLTVNDLINYASKYGIYLSPNQAVKIIRILKQQRIDISNKSQIMRIIWKIENEVSENLRNKVINLIKQL